jgi:hypothetical protein
MQFKGNPECDSSMDSNTGPSMGSKGNDEFPLPVLVCIAKLEQNYIEEFVQYHLALGFARIYLFDNEDVPTYEALLKPYVDSGHLYVTHLPRNDHVAMNEFGQKCFVPVQYLALHLFSQQVIPDPTITHVAHIDIDEFIVLKKHANIREFITEYIKGDCAGIGMNWRFFGSSFNKDPIEKPVTERFTMCEARGNMHIKTLFRKDCFARFDGCHTIKTTTGHIKSTDGTIIEGPYNEKAPIDVIQVNHYKCKTLPEYRYIRTRMRADVVNAEKEDVDADFKKYDINEVEDLTIKGTRQRELVVPFRSHTKINE